MTSDVMKSLLMRVGRMKRASVASSPSARASRPRSW